MFQQGIARLKNYLGFSSSGDFGNGGWDDSYNQSLPSFSGFWNCNYGYEAVTH